VFCFIITFGLVHSFEKQTFCECLKKLFVLCSVNDVVGTSHAAINNTVRKTQQLETQQVSPDSRNILF